MAKACSCAYAHESNLETSKKIFSETAGDLRGITSNHCSMRDAQLSTVLCLAFEIDRGIKGRKTVNSLIAFRRTMIHYYCSAFREIVLFLEPFNNQHISGFVSLFSRRRQRPIGFIFGLDSRT